MNSKRLLSYMITSVCTVGILLANMVQPAYAADQIIYAYLISKPGIYVNYTNTFYARGAGKTLGMASDPWDSENPYSGKLDVSTNFTLRTSVYVEDPKWTGPQTFSWNSGSSGELAESVSGSYYIGNNDGSSQMWITASKSVWMPKFKILPITSVSNVGTHTFDVYLRVPVSQAKTYKGESSGTAAAFEYKSVKSLPPPSVGGGGGGDPDPPTEPDIPSEAMVRISVSAGDATANYKTFNGNVTATASASDDSDYGNDDADIDTIDVEIEAGNESDSNSGSGSRVSASVSPSFNNNSNWLSGSGGRYQYDADGRASIELDNGSSDSARDSDTGTIYMTNDAPSTSLSLTTQNQNGGPVPNGFYYVGVPIDLRAVYSDPEDDINFVQLAIGTKDDMDAGYAELVYDTNTNQHECVGNSFTESGATYSLKNYSSTLTFKNPGTYSYRVYVRDAKSNKSVERDALAQGTFVVRGEPQPPKAIITSPRYAFENEPFKVTQGSTDPNGVDDIIAYNWTNAVDVTETADPDKYDPLTFKPITPSSSWPGNGTVNGKNGGTITFPTGSTHHSFNIKLGVKDATNLTDNTEQIIKVISDVPVANLVVKDNNGSDTLKENRKITISAENSLAPSKSPILWNESTWTIESVNGKQDANIKEDTNQRNGNKQRVLQFDKPGDYRVTLVLKNQFAKDNPSHEDIAAATYSMIIHVNEDKVPKSEVTVISAKPNFADNPVDYTVKFRANSASIDGDKIVAPSAYEWTVYEDYNSDGQFTADEVVPQNKLTFNAEKTEVYMQTKYEQGRHNTIKVVVKTTETFAEPTLTQFLAADGSYKRSITAETTEVINWIPKIVVTPDQGIGTDPGTYNPRPGTPYEDVDLDGDGVTDGKFIRAYTDDTFNVSTIITDEFPETAKVTWDIKKKDHTGGFSSISPDGSLWINSGKVSSTLGHDGGGLRIDSPGIYTLTATVTDDCGDTGTFTLNARVYTLPQAVLETNPNYRFYGVWETKENIRFDLRSDPTIVDDEWGKAWHRMYWDLDCWEITPLERQNTSEIHVMTPEYSGRFNNQSADGLKFIGTNSKLGGITGNAANKNQPYRSMCFTEPGKYEIRYWGTNYGGKVTVPVKYTVNVQIDLPPDIKGSVEPTFYRDPADGNKAKILLSGPYSNVIGRDALTILSNDGDYIDYIKVKVIYDSNNNKLFTDSTDTQWLLNEGSGTTGGLQYVLNKINPYGN